MNGAIGKNSINNSLVWPLITFLLGRYNGDRGNFRATATGQFFQFCVSDYYGRKKIKKKENQVRKKKEKDRNG